MTDTLDDAFEPSRPAPPTSTSSTVVDHNNNVAHDNLAALPGPPTPRT